MHWCKQQYVFSSGHSLAMVEVHLHDHHLIMESRFLEGLDSSKGN